MIATVRLRERCCILLELSSVPIFSFIPKVRHLDRPCRGRIIQWHFHGFLYVCSGQYSRSLTWRSSWEQLDVMVSNVHRDNADTFRNLRRLFSTTFSHSFTLREGSMSSSSSNSVRSDDSPIGASEREQNTVLRCMWRNSQTTSLLSSRIAHRNCC